MGLGCGWSAMVRLKHNRQNLLLGLAWVGMVVLALALGFSDRLLLPQLEQGPLADWVTGNILVVTGLMIGLGVVSARRTESGRGLLLWSLAGLLAGVEWVLGNLGGAILVSHWIPAPTNIFHLLLPVLCGLVCCAPVLAVPIMRTIGKRHGATSLGAGGT